LRPIYLPITPLSSPWPTTCSYSIKYSFRFRMFRPGQASRRQISFTYFPVPSCGVVTWVTDLITPLATFPSRPMQSDNLCRMILAGQQACPQRLFLPFLGHLNRSYHPVSQRIILVGHCVPANWSVPRGRSYIIRVIRRKRFVRWRSPDNRYYVITFICL
jgi:hypothetical protein